MHAIHGILAVALVAALTPGACAGGVKFTAGPTAQKAGDTVRIAFTVSEPTDVEVAVLGADGKVLRHLAAGVLGGKNPPPVPLRPGLSQAVLWDGQDDFGKPAAGAPFRVRLRAGTTVNFGRMIGGSPYVGEMDILSGGDSVAVGPDGSLYVKMASICTCTIAPGNRLCPWQVRRFRSDGAYERTLLPYPPSTGKDNVPGFQLVNDGGDGLTPCSRSAFYPVFFAFGDELHHRLVDGALVFIDVAGLTLNLFKPGTLHDLRTVSIGLPKGAKPLTAFSPDGSYAYYADARTAGVIYRQALSSSHAAAEKFAELQTANKFVGIDVDAQGNVLAADHVGQRIVEIGPDGALRSETPVPVPCMFRVQRKSGMLYVVSCGDQKGAVPEMLKVSGRGKAARVEARVKLAGFPRPPSGMALDEHASPTVAWIHSTRMLVRVEDQGTALGVSRRSVMDADQKAIPTFLNYVAADPQAECVYALALPQRGQMDRGVLCRYDGETGEGGPTKIKTIDVAVGPDGSVFAWGNGSYEGPVLRYTRELAPYPLPGTDSNAFGRCGGRFGRGHNAGGMAVDLRGRVYVYHSIGGDFSEYVSAFGPDGQPVATQRQVPLRASTPDDKRYALIAGVNPCGGGLKVDREGNIYLGQTVPVDIGQKKHVNPDIPRGFVHNPQYYRSVGSILKFAAAGGINTRPRGWWEKRPPPDTFWWWTGVKQVYQDYGCFSGGGGGCVCARSRFDLDRFGRLYIPSPVTFQVSVRDNNDNEIVRFGGYGNFDARGPRSDEPRPSIPFGWPTMVAAGEKYIYVGDQLNCRIVRIDKTFAAEETCAVK